MFKPSFAMRLEAMMRARGFNPRSLSLKANLGATAVRDILTGRSGSPKIDTVQRLADVLECKVEDLMPFAPGQGILVEGDVSDFVSVKNADKHAENLDKEIHRVIGASDAKKVTVTLNASAGQSLDPAAGSGAMLNRLTDLPAIASMPRDVPVYGTAVGGGDALFMSNGDVVDYVRRPPGLAHQPQVFGIYVSGSSMSPRFEEGELVYVSTVRPARPGDDVVVEMHGTEDGPGPAFIKRLVRKTTEKVVVRQFNPEMELSYDAGRIKHVYRVVPLAELLGI